MRHGMSVGLLSAVSDAAHLSEQPYLLVLRTARELQRSPALWRSSDELENKGQFIVKEAITTDLLDYTVTPWAKDAKHLPKGKQYQIRFLAEVLNRNRLTRGDNGIPQQHPLLSQPLIELCLRIPTYLLLKGGKQRALARAAFQDCVPAEIIARENKGDATSHVADAIRRSEPFIRDVLLDGHLVRKGIVNPETLRPILALGQPMRVADCWPLLACMAAEIWVRTSSSSSIRAVA
jgi:asparagine synthase (glutamine-hydrolysing)